MAYALPRDCRKSVSSLVHTLFGNHRWPAIGWSMTFTYGLDEIGSYIQWEGYGESKATMAYHASLVYVSDHEEGMRQYNDLFGWVHYVTLSHVRY